MTVKFWPPIVNVPDRVIVGFIETLKVTAPLPLKTFSPEIWSQLELLFTVKSQLGGAVIKLLPRS